jgi:hypothetical protein
MSSGSNQLTVLKTTKLSAKDGDTEFTLANKKRFLRLSYRHVIHQAFHNIAPNATTLWSEKSDALYRIPLREAVAIV